MSQQCFPYNSVDGDRRYKAEEFRDYYAQLIGNGVVYSSSTALKAVEDEGMTLAVSAGGAFIEGVGYINTADYSVTLSTADGSLSRIDRIVVRNDYEARDTYIDVLEGTPASSPVAPSLTRDADMYEIAIADVLVSGGVTEITQSAITDTRLDSDLCGIVTALIEQADTTDIFNQFQTYLKEFKATYITDIEEWSEERKEAFVAWVAELQEILDESVAGNLQNEIDANAQDVFMRYYGLVPKTTTVSPDGTITAVSDEATVVTEFADGDGGVKMITETVTPSGSGTSSYVKTTTVTPQDGGGKVITEEYREVL